MTTQCIFCQIAKGTTPTPLVYEDDTVIAFDDLSPKAPHHKLIIPKIHIPTLNDIPTSNENLIGHMVWVAKQLAQQCELDQKGYRLVMNCNADGGQTVFHIHAHLLGGRKLNWPPG